MSAAAAAAPAPAPFRPRLNLLVAYPYVTPQITAAVAAMGDDCRWLVDSGAFTAWKLGRAITLDSYCSFLDGLPVKPWRYFALDVIGDPDATARNFEAMRARGYDPIPILTRGASLAELDALYGVTDYVGLGGVAGIDRASHAWVRAVMQHVGDRRVHILGYTDMNWVKYLRPTSCDSSTWEQAARFGNLNVYVGHGRLNSYPRHKAANQPSPAIMRGLRAVGVDPYQLRADAAWAGGNSLIRWAAAAAWVRMSIDTERNLGTLLFLALAANRPDLMCGAFRAVTGRSTLDAERMAYGRKEAA